MSFVRAEFTTFDDGPLRTIFMFIFLVLLNSRAHIDSAKLKTLM